MTNLAADLLSVPKIEVKERRAVTKSVSITQVLQQAHETVGRLARERGHGVNLNISGDLPEVLGKHDDLLRVFINLTENAINYSRETRTVTITTESRGKDNPLRRKAICISVTDQGDGMPAADIMRLTERPILSTKPLARCR